MSVSVWVKPSSFTNSWQYIVDKSQDLNSTYVNRSWSIRITSAGILELELRANNVFYVYTSTTTLSLSNWSHLVYTFDGLVAKLYYNTNLILSQNVIGILPTTNNSDLSIGYFPHTSMPPYGYFWNGKIDDIGYWNRALAQEEISALYNGAPAGITSVNKEKNINAFPNPSKNKFNLTVDDQFMHTNYKVIDQIGKSLCDGVINTSNTEIDLSSFASGIYFIQVGNLNKETIKIVKE